MQVQLTKDQLAFEDDWMMDKKVSCSWGGWGQVMFTGFLVQSFNEAPSLMLEALGEPATSQVLWENHENYFGCF